MSASLDHSSTLPFDQTQYELLPPRSAIQRFDVLLPTSSSTRPLRTSLVIDDTTTLSQCIDMPSDELGLPVSTLELAGPGSRSRASRRSRPITDEDEAPEPIRWALTMNGESGERAGMDDRVLETIARLGGTIIRVSLDREWLFEPSHSRPRTAKRIDHVQGGDDNISLALSDLDSDLEPSTPGAKEEKDDTLKAHGQGLKSTSTPSAHITPTRPKPTARLSSIFAATVDTNQHPAPPSTPQMTLVNGGDLAGAIAEALSDGDHGLPVHGIGDQVDLNELGKRFASPMSTKGHNSKSRSVDVSGPARLLFGKSSPTSAISPDTPELASSPTPPSPSPHAFVSLSAGTGVNLTRLLPQSTGGSVSSTPGDEGWSKRFTLPSFGGWMGSPASTLSRIAGEMPPADTGSMKSSAQVSMASSIRPLEKQTTGGLWGWWAGVHQPEEGSAEAFVQGLVET